MARRMRSRPRKPAWPSLVWNTCGVDAERVERAHAADAEEDLLAQAVLDVAAVEAVGDRAQVVGSFSSMSASSRYSGMRPDVGPPDLRVHGAPARSTSTRTPSHQRERHRVGVEVGVALLLPAVGRSSWRK